MISLKGIIESATYFLGVPNKNLRINTYGGLIPFVSQEPSTYTVQCAKITHMDDEVCGGMIHTIDKVLMPPIGNLMDLLSMDPKHSTFMELIKFADLENEINEHVGPLTILAPRYGIEQFDVGFIYEGSPSMCEFSASGYFC